MILLDTHALIWWVDGTGERLSTRARKRVEKELARVQRGEAQAGLLVSAISCWDVAMLVNRGRLALSLELERWLALVAQARAMAVPLLSADSRIQAYPHVQWLW